MPIWTEIWPSGVRQASSDPDNGGPDRMTVCGAISASGQDLMKHRIVLGYHLSLSQVQVLRRKLSGPNKNPETSTF